MIKRLLIVPLLACVGTNLLTSQVYADSWLCNSQNSSSFSVCIDAGYTAHGYENHNYTSYWNAYVLSGGHNCTNYVGYMLTQNGDSGHSVAMGNAERWDDTIKDYPQWGYTVNTTPAVGSVALWDYANGGTGHVAYVEEIVDATTIRISEDNAPIYNSFRWRTITTTGDWPDKFLHIADTSSIPFTTFQSNTNTLYSYDGTNSTNTTKGMSTGTSPATAQIAGSNYVTALRANTGDLYVYNYTTGISTNTGQGVKAGTSPAITGFSGSGWQVVFQGSDGYLHGYDSSGNAVNYQQGMKDGTSPAITSLYSGGWRVVFQANTGNLYVYSVSNGGSSSTNLSQGMSAATSPSITALSGSTWVASFQANTGVAYVYSSAVGYGQSLGINMASGTSPAIAGLSSSVYAVLVQHTSGNLWRYQLGVTTTDSGQGMKASASPAIRRTATDVYYGAFQANTGNLHAYTDAGGGLSTGQGMDPATSPSMALLVPAE